MNIKILAILFFFFIVAIIPTHSQTECPTAPTPQLIIGQQGNVTPGPPNNVRDLPSRDGVLIGEIPGASVFVVLDGPVCDGEIYWWQVDYEGLIGWTAEGKNDTYWVVPIASTPTPTATNTATPTITPTFTPTVTATQIPIQVEKILEVQNNGSVLQFQYSPDGSMISMVRPNLFKILDAVTLDTILEIDLKDIPDFERWAFEASWHPDSKQLAVTISDRFHVYSIPEGELLWEKILPHYFLYKDRNGKESLEPETIKSLQFTPDSKQLITFGDDGIVRVWNYGEDEPTVAINAREIEIQSRTRGIGKASTLDISSDGEILAFSFFDSEVILWNLDLGGPLYNPQPVRYSSGVVSQVYVSFTPDDNAIYYHARSPNMYIFDLSSRRSNIKSAGNGFTNRIGFHPNNQWIVYILDKDEGDSLVVANRGTLDRRADIPIADNSFSFDISPDGRYLILAEVSKSISLWEISE